MTARYIVIDTNVWIRQFLSPGGAADAAITKALERYTPVFDLDTFEELRTRLERSKVAKLSTPEQRQAYLAGAVENSVFVERTYQVKRVLEDPDDNKFLGLAMTVGAPNIISGDAHLEGIKH